MQVDYLIVGQGISGTFLSRYLVEAGKSVVVMDDNAPFSASKIASGVINPVTGRRIVRTWMIEELLPFAEQEYQRLGDELGINLVKKVAMLDFHPSLQMKEAFDKRINEEQEYLHQTDEWQWKENFNFYFGVNVIRPCLLIDIRSMLSSWQTYLLQQNRLLIESFDPFQLSIGHGSINYKSISADKIIFCDGVNGVNNPFFKNLPYSLNKGEAVIAKIPGLDPKLIYKQGLSIVPWKDDLFWIGSTYEWNFNDLFPTVSFLSKVKFFLDHFLKTPYEIVEHFASARPANVERRPFVGLHPTISAVGILNGMGTKGCSLAPFFAKQLSEWLVKAKPILPEADVKRFKKTLGRTIN